MKYEHKLTTGNNSKDTNKCNYNISVTCQIQNPFIEKIDPKHFNWLENGNILRKSFTHVLKC